MAIVPEDIRAAVAARLADAQELLCELIRVRSLPGKESAAMDVAAEAFTPLGRVERVGLSNDLRDDDDYCDPVPDIDYTGRSNLRVVTAGGGGEGKSLLLCTHLDTVPPSKGQPNPYDPQQRDGSIFGLGSCDAKGQVATIYLVLAALRELNVPLGGELITHLVVEEEVGGNGAIAMARCGERADGCIVLEPTDLKILTSIRGSVWFRIKLRGKAGHAGTPGKSRSAVDMAIRVVEILKAYHDRLLSASRGDPLFDRHADPMPLTVGKLHAGHWPATAAAEAVLECVQGLLPPRTARQVAAEITAAVRDQGGPDIADNFDIHFMFRHDPSVIAVDHPLVAGLVAAARDAGSRGDIDAMTASCDACFYNNRLQIPTLVFGGGSLGVAHSAGEHMPLAELAKAAEILLAAALQWCSAKL